MYWVSEEWTFTFSDSMLRVFDKAEVTREEFGKMLQVCD